MRPREGTPMASAALLFQVLPGGWPVSSSVVWNGMPRHFRLEDAELLLPDVEQALRDAIFQKSEYEAADGELDRAMQRIRMAGGSRVSPGSDSGAAGAQRFRGGGAGRGDGTHQ